MTFVSVLTGATSSKGVYISNMATVLKNTFRPATSTTGHQDTRQSLKKMQKLLNLAQMKR